MKDLRKKITIGRKDKLDFPDLGLYDIDVKIDTGAYTGAIHCHNIAVFNENHQKMTRFNLLDPSHKDYDEKEFVLPVYNTKQVKSSSGTAEERIFIKTNMLIFGQLREVELSLTDRSDMKFPVLLGRKILKSWYLVDVARTNVSYRQKKRHISS